MATFLAYHYYRRKPEFDKQSYGISEIFPIEDREVPDKLLRQYEDITEEKKHEAVQEKV